MSKAYSSQWSTFQWLQRDSAVDWLKADTSDKISTASDHCILVLRILATILTSLSGASTQIAVMLLA